MKKKIKVILLENTAGLGNKGTLLEVSPAYANNSLIPKGIAKLADINTVNKIEQEEQKKITEKNKNQEKFLNLLQQNKEEALCIEKAVSPMGKLYEKIDEKVISLNIVSQYKINIPKKNIKLNKKIENIGDYEAEINFESKKYKIKIKVIGK
ncbi:50S ribosomal protein L9 [Candidatus Vampirococcus lugosii]|uniref:Large ribosomal subunit protein bL9 n=1 Tax=Candidatus Vampirococcus lugosii TaxID=2789015 RepID=A0ABS5QMP9_9BACT|nr:50S ribosomal protein L9 [Candidatus Vampirococcus lugosii]MBS8122352.1 Ribosomal protein L9 [Candidatus Vampirococcus lugosii]